MTLLNLLIQRKIEIFGLIRSKIFSNYKLLIFRSFCKKTQNQTQN
jgi:hypothetical protein